MTNMHKISVVEAEGKKPVRRPSRRWKNKKMDRKQIECESVDRTHLKITGSLYFAHRPVF
jgi:hypothetical protein